MSAPYPVPADARNLAATPTLVRDLSERLDQVLVYEARFNDEPTRIRITCLAQQFGRALPPLVVGTPADDPVTTPMRIDVDQLVFLLLREQQEMRRRIAALERRR